MIKRFSGLSIGVKFALIASAWVLVSFGALSLLMSVTMTRYLDEQMLSDLKLANHQVQALVEVFDDATGHDVQRLAKNFAGYFPHPIRLDPGRSMDIGTLNVPLLRTGSERI